MKNGVYEDVNQEILCECDTEQDADEQVAIYINDDKKEGACILYNILLKNYNGWYREDLAEDNAPYTLVLENKDVLFKPYAWTNRDKDETETLRKIIRTAKAEDNRNIEFYYLIKQVEGEC